MISTCYTVLIYTELHFAKTGKLTMYLRLTKYPQIGSGSRFLLINCFWQFWVYQGIYIILRILYIHMSGYTKKSTFVTFVINIHIHTNKHTYTQTHTSKRTHKHKQKHTRAKIQTQATTRTQERDRKKKLNKNSRNYTV